jgi:hypothetical protein
MMLIDRAATGDREKAKTLLNQALGTYTRIGMHNDDLRICRPGIAGECMAMIRGPR